jgi:hypothetical protein
MTIRYILIATDRSTGRTMYYGDTFEWHYSRGFAARMAKAVAERGAKHLNETDRTVFDVAVVAE